MEVLTRSLGLSVLRRISTASNSTAFPLSQRYLFFTISTTSFGLGVADAMYHGLEAQWKGNNNGDGEWGRGGQGMREE